MLIISIQSRQVTAPTATGELFSCHAVTDKILKQKATKKRNKIQN